MPTNKALGQHWLQDRAILARIADAAQITKNDTVLEIGPGLGTLTSELLRRAGNVVAVEFDEALAEKLPGQFPGTSLKVIHQDILSYDLSQLPKDYIVVANVPYYITSKIIDKLMTAENRPVRSVLLVQKEVAERIAGEPGTMSLLALSAQLYTTTRLDCEVPREYFTPPPKVDSQVVILEGRDEPLIALSEQKMFWRVTHAGFANKRKKLRSSLSAGLALPVVTVETALRAADIDPNLRAQALSIADWQRVAEALDL